MDMQTQLRSLSIPRDQRPQAARPARSGSTVKGFLLALLLIGGGWGAMHYFKPEIGERIGSMVGTAAEAAPIRVIDVALSREPSSQPVLTATGKIVSDHRVSVSTKVSGQIVSLSFEQGDRVEMGQTLARVEDVLYRARRDEAAARLERAKANLTFQKVNFDRVSSLMARESAPDIEFADAKRALEESQAQVEAERATLDFAQKALDDCEVVAPIAGVILTRNVEVGDFVAAEGGRGAMANAQFATIADMSKLRVEVDVSEMDIVRIVKDMPCAIIPDAYKQREYPGFVMWLDPGANYSKATVQVKARIENPDDFLRVEGSAQVAFYKESPSREASLPPAIWIPASACRMNADPSTGTVFRLEKGRLHKSSVTIGKRQGDQLEILGGLSAGQSIALDNLESLHEGQRAAP